MVMGCLFMKCEVNKGDEKVDRGCMERIWCENKPRRLPTVEPTMVCQIQICLRFLCPLCKLICLLSEIIFFNGWPFNQTTTNPMSPQNLSERIKLSRTYCMQRVMHNSGTHTSVTTLPLLWTSRLYSLEWKPKQSNQLHKKKTCSASPTHPSPLQATTNTDNLFLHTHFINTEEVLHIIFEMFLKCQRWHINSHLVYLGMCLGRRIQLCLTAS